MGFMNKVAGLLGGVAASVASPSVWTGRRSGGYMRDSVTFGNWNPFLREKHQDVASAWQEAAARATDSIHNSGWLSGAIEQAVADTVGTGLRLNAMPDPIALGMSPEAAANLGNEIERRFRYWAEDPMECDLEARRTFGQMQSASFRMWFATGEMLSEVAWKRRVGRTYGTKMRIIPPLRLSAKSQPFDRIVHGVVMDEDNAPKGYIFTQKDIFGIYGDVFVPARDEYGRPRIIHAFDGQPGMFRGITPLVSALRVARQFDQLADATLMASIVQSVFAATITAESPTEEVLEGFLTDKERGMLAKENISPVDAWFEMQAGWNERSHIDANVPGRIAHLFPGHELQFHGSKANIASYEKFAMHLLRELARCIGVTYESATGDYEGVTFSSIRMAVNSIFEITKMRRTNIIAPFCQGAYESWLEEEVDSGRLALPGGINQFVANRSAICRASWIGSPKPQPDDGKAATAQQKWQQMGVVSDAQIALENGQEIDDVYAERAREMKLRQKLGLPEPATPAGSAKADEEPDDEGAKPKPRGK